MPRGYYDRTQRRKPLGFPEDEPSALEVSPRGLVVDGPLYDEEEVAPEPQPESQNGEKSVTDVDIAPRRSIDTAPKDGTTVLLFSPTVTHGVRGRWRTTRQFKNGRWTPNAYWACPLTNTGLGLQWTEWEPLG